MPDPRAVASFLSELMRTQVPFVSAPATLTFLATTGAPQTAPAVGLARVLALGPGEAPADVEVRLAGALPRALRVGENVTVSISRYEQFRGYQVKTSPLRAHGAEAELVSRTPAGELMVHAHQAYTTHHGPYELRFFERIPFDEVRATVGACRHAVLAIGPQANISPRFVWHHELKLGRLVTYHGDGVMMKTYRNLTVNAASARLAFDFERLTGFALHGPCTEVSPDDHPEGWQKTCAGFTALGFGKPSRLFRHEAERIEPVVLGATQPGPALTPVPRAAGGA